MNDFEIIDPLERIWENYKNKELEKIIDKFIRFEISNNTSSSDIFEKFREDIPTNWLPVSTFFPNYDVFDVNGPDFSTIYEEIKEPYDHHISLLLNNSSPKLWLILKALGWLNVIRISVIDFAPYSKFALQLMEILFDLKRFLRVQEHTYEQALAEIRNGKKKTHWIWWIFPQLVGLGKSEMSKTYGIKDSIEAAAYLTHPILKERLIEVCQAVLDSSNSVYEIFGNDAMKVRACCKLFSENSYIQEPIFHKLIERYMWN